MLLHELNPSFTVAQNRWQCALGLGCGSIEECTMCPILFSSLAVVHALCLVRLSLSHSRFSPSNLYSLRRYCIPLFVCGSDLARVLRASRPLSPPRWAVCSASFARCSSLVTWSLWWSV